MFNTNEFGAAGKRLNADFLKTLPKMACKATIVGGGVKTFDNKEKGGQDKVPYLTLTSASWEGEKELSLNASNRNLLGATLGTNAGAWVGQEIGVYFDPAVTYAGKAVGGIKVRAFTPDPFAASANAPAAAPVADDLMPF